MSATKVLAPDEVVMVRSVRVAASQGCRQVIPEQVVVESMTRVGSTARTLAAIREQVAAIYDEATGDDMDGGAVEVAAARVLALVELEFRLSGGRAVA